MILQTLIPLTLQKAFIGRYSYIILPNNIVTFLDILSLAFACFASVQQYQQGTGEQAQANDLCHTQRPQHQAVGTETLDYKAACGIQH